MTWEREFELSAEGVPYREESLAVIEFDDAGLIRRIRSRTTTSSPCWTRSPRACRAVRMGLPQADRVPGQDGFVTSGTEEIGWRGYLTEKLLPGRGFWDAGWLVGVVWAVWHLPVATMIFLQQGMVHVQIAGSLVGFAMGIVAMAILQAWFYERTRSVFLSMVIHAAFNTLPLTLVLLWEGSPAAVVTDLLLWAVVIYLQTRSQHMAKATAA